MLGRRVGGLNRRIGYGRDICRNGSEESQEAL